MTDVELSAWIEDNFPANAKSILQRKRVCGIGVNDAKYCISPRLSGRKLYDPCYRTWQNMLMRCYDHKFQEKHPTYVGIIVSDNWHVYSEFRTWWMANHIDGWEIDKDLLYYGNNVYSPNTCIFVPAHINTFTTDCGSSRGEFPIGVHWKSANCKFVAQCNNQITGKRRYLGLFDSSTDAHKAWIKYKLQLAYELKPEMDAIDGRIYNNVVSIIKSLSP